MHIYSFCYIIKHLDQRKEVVGRHSEDITEHHQMTATWEHSDQLGSPTAQPCYAPINNYSLLNKRVLPFLVCLQCLETDSQLVLALLCI